MVPACSVTRRVVRSPWFTSVAVAMSMVAAPVWANFELVPTKPANVPDTSRRASAGLDTSGPPNAAPPVRPAGGSNARPASAGSGGLPRAGKPSSACNLSEQVLGASELRADGSCR